MIYSTSSQYVQDQNICDLPLTVIVNMWVSQWEISHVIWSKSNMWTEGLRCDLPFHQPQHIQNPQRFCWKQKRACSSPPRQIRCHPPPTHPTPLACSQSKWSPCLVAHPSTFPAFSSARSPDATAWWAIFHKEISTLPVKCCFSLWLLTLGNPLESENELQC